ncbi:hypothetical protein SERLA73DRAFT_173381 [Serpula lacrymans var. lacrymans S7.3]|uniref:Uncharacterized protein n=1 Tax=Serpula lacrymans var. lacrymans (strain S7.3) TaxID=936435 RepID=F8QJ02_SERL3|nr:hypothetical protein SERLA73DRAFT_173381 [Serpula lacrymans var. lacrymans S7.3]
MCSKEGNNKRYHVAGGKRLTTTGSSSGSPVVINVNVSVNARFNEFKCVFKRAILSELFDNILTNANHCGVEGARKCRNSR